MCPPHLSLADSYINVVMTMTVHPGPGQSCPLLPFFFVVVAGVIFSFTCEVVGIAATARQPGCCHAGEKEGVFCLGCSIRAALQ